MTKPALSKRACTATLFAVSGGSCRRAPAHRPCTATAVRGPDRTRSAPRRPGRRATREREARRPLRRLPSTIIIQTDWWPQAEYGATYGLLGPDYTVNTDNKIVSGPLYSHGQPTGVDVEIRAGSSAIGDSSVRAEMYTHEEITFGVRLDRRPDHELGDGTAHVGRRPAREEPADHHVGPRDVPRDRDVGRPRRGRGHRQRVRRPDVHRRARRRRDPQRRSDRPVVRRQPGRVHRGRRVDRPAGLRLVGTVHLRAPRGVGQAGHVRAASTTPASRTTRRRCAIRPATLES